MMKSFWFLEIFLDAETLRWTNHISDLSFDSVSFTGLGDRFTPPDKIRRSGSLKSEKITLKFDGSRQNDSGDAIGGLLDENVRRRRVRLRRVVWDPSGAPDAGEVWVDELGRIENLKAPVKMGSSPEILLNIESGALVYLERNNQMRSPANQKAIFAGDLGVDLAPVLAGSKVKWRTKDNPDGTVEFEWPKYDDPPSRRMLIGEFAREEGDFIAKFTNGQQRKYYQQVRAIADHVVEEVNKVWLNGEVVYSGVLAHGVRTELTSLRSGGARAWITVYYGYEDQTADSYLVSAEALWTANHRLRGVAYFIAEMLWDSDNTQNPAFSVGGKGAKFYDRRKDTTAGGSGSHRFNDPASWEYTKNAGVILDHFRLGRRIHTGSEAIWFGVGETPEFVPYAEAVALSDQADEDVTLKGALGTEKRWEMNGVLLAADSHKDNLEKIAACMCAEVYDAGGKVVVRPIENYNSATVVATLTDGDLVRGGQYEYDPLGQIKDSVNRVEGRFPDPEQDFKSVDYPAVDSDTYLTEDGERISKTFNQRHNTSVYRCQRFASLKLEDSRRVGTLKEPFLGSAARGILPGSMFNRTSDIRGISSPKTFEAKKVTTYKDGTVEIEALELYTDQPVWDEDNAADLPVAPVISPVGLPTIPTPDVTVTAAELTNGGVKKPVLNIAVTVPADLTDLVADRMEVELTPSGGTAKNGFVDIEKTAFVIDGLLPGTSYAVRFRYHLAQRKGSWTSTFNRTTTANDEGTGVGDVSWDDITGKPADLSELDAAADAALNQIGIDLNSLETVVLDPSTGLSVRLGDAETAITTIEGDYVGVTDLDAVKAELGAFYGSQLPTAVGWTGDAQNGPAENRADLTSSNFSSLTSLTANIASFQGADVAYGPKVLVPVTPGVVYEVTGFVEADNVATDHTHVYLHCYSHSATGAIPGWAGVEFSEAATPGTRQTITRRFCYSGAVDTNGESNIQFGPSSRFVSFVVGARGGNSSSTGKIYGLIIKEVGLQRASEATVSILKQAFIDGAGNAIARLALTAAAGGNPARLTLLDGVGGSNIALDADQLFFGDNTVFEDAKNTFYTISGTRRLRMMGPFGSSNNLLIWYGPSSVALNSETTANAEFALTIDGQIVVPSSSAPFDLTGSAVLFDGSAVYAVNASITPRNNTGTVSYSWSFLSGDDDIYCFTSTTTRNAQFRTTVNPISGQSKRAVWRCVATDSGSGDTAYFDASIIFAAL